MDPQESADSNEIPFNPDDYIVDPEENALLPDLNEPAEDIYGFYEVQAEPPDVAMILLELGQVVEQGDHGGLHADPPPFQGLNVGNMQDAQNQVALQAAVGNVNQLFGHDEWIVQLHQDRLHICRTMMGMGEPTTVQWLAFNNPANARFREDQEFIIELHAYMNEFILQPPAHHPPLRHIRRDCDPNLDPGACCFYTAFGDWINAVNQNPIQRQHSLWQKFCAEITLVITEMFTVCYLKKAYTGLYPEHVHQIMESWWNSRHLAGIEGVTNLAEEDRVLASVTGLTISTLRSYKSRMTNRRYDFLTHQMVARGPALPIPAPEGQAGVPGQAPPLQRRGGRRRFLGPPPLQGG